MDPVGGILMTGLDPHPGSKQGGSLDPHPGGADFGPGLDPHPGGDNGMPSGLGMGALSTTRAALVRPGEGMGFAVVRPPAVNLWRLSADLVARVVGQQLQQRLVVAHGSLWLVGLPAADGTLTTPATRLLTIESPAVAQVLGKAVLQRQTQIVIDRAEERAERGAEIQLQAATLWPFFSSITYIDPARAPRVATLVAMVGALASDTVQQFKHQLACPRPADCSPSVQPMLLTPSHASLPSGHATAAYAMQGILQLLLGWGDNHPGAVALRRLAYRIADNRVVAGLHFPIDSCAGWLLADTLVAVVAAAAIGGTMPVGRSFGIVGPMAENVPTAGRLPVTDGFGIGDVPGCSAGNAAPVAVDLNDDLRQLAQAAVTELITLGLRAGATHEVG